MKTNLYYKDKEGILKALTAGSAEEDLTLVKDQGKLCEDIIHMGLDVPVTPVLCCIESNKEPS